MADFASMLSSLSGPLLGDPNRSAYDAAFAGGGQGGGNVTGGNLISPTMDPTFQALFDKISGMIPSERTTVTSPTIDPSYKALYDKIAGVVPTERTTVTSPTVDPTFSRLLGESQAAIPQNLPSLQDIVSQGATSPLLEAIIGPALQRLVAPQAQQMQQLTDITRAAGGLRGSTYGGNVLQLLNEQGLQRNDLMSNIIAKTLGTLVPGQLQENEQAFLPQKALSALTQLARPEITPNKPEDALTNLLRTISPEITQNKPEDALMQLLQLISPRFQPPSGGGGGGGGGGWENIPPSMGLATPSQASAMPTTAGPGQWGYVNGRLQQIPYPDTGGGYNPPAAAAPTSGYDPLTQYLLGSQGATNPIQQTGESSWSTVPYAPLTDYASTNMEY